MTNYIKYWNNPEEVVYWFREWGVKAWLDDNVIVWMNGLKKEYMYMGQTVVWVEGDEFTVQ